MRRHAEARTDAARSRALASRRATMTRQRGFTLLEVMIALAVLAVMMVVAWGTTIQTGQAKREFEAIQDRYREMRVATSRLARDFTMAYLSANEDRTQLEPRTFFVGESSGDLDSVHFTMFGHTSLFADANESDQTVVTYFAERDRDNANVMNLMRRESRRLASQNERYDALAATTDVLFAGVTKFKLAYWDVKNREWKDSWSTQNTEGQLPTLPDRVRITISFEDEGHKELTFVTQTRVHMQEMLQFYAN